VTLSVIKNLVESLAGTGVLLVANIYIPSISPTGIFPALSLKSLTFGVIQLAPPDSEVMNPGSCYTL